MTDDQLEARLAAALSPPPSSPPEDRVAAVRARAQQLRASPGRGPGTADGTGAASGTRSPGRRLVLALAAGALVVAGAGALAGLLGPDGDGDPGSPVGGDGLARSTPEFAAVLSADGVDVSLDGSRAPEGRVVVVSSTTLPVLPVGEYYELWFTGPDDSPASPQRVSAGTFHPDYDAGTTRVVLHAAIDPALFPRAEITRERADGDPVPSADVVLEGGIELLDAG